MLSTGCWKNRDAVCRVKPRAATSGIPRPQAVDPGPSLRYTFNRFRQFTNEQCRFDSSIEAMGQVVELPSIEQFPLLVGYKLSALNKQIVQ